MNIKKISSLTQYLLLGVIIAVSVFLSISASRQESAIMDELAHIPAGYGYVKYFDYRLNPEHPPLIKALAAFPLLFQNLNFPTDRSAWQNEINGQWVAGAQFLYESGNDADKIVQTSRFGPILITLLLIIFIYICAKELIGRWWALLPVALFAFSPTVLSHGHFVTTDLGAAFGIFIATYYLVKYLLAPSKKHLAFSGIAFGIAQLMKFSAVLLIPFFIFIVAVFYIWKFQNEIRGSSFWNAASKFLKFSSNAVLKIISIFVIGYLLVYAVYFLFTINYPVEKQTHDTEFTLTSFAGGPGPGLQSCKLSFDRKMRCLAEINIAMAKNKILRPMAEYMLGVLMVMQRASGGNTGYFLGEVSAAGWWYYFPVVFALKEPVPSLILIAFAFLLSVWAIIKKFKNQNSLLKTFNDYLGTNFAEFSMISFVVFYWAYSIKSPLNIGIRHILPTIPFIYILTAGMLKKWTSKNSVFSENLLKTATNIAKNSLKISLKSGFIAILLIWYFAETALAYPHFLSYFNEFGGSTDRGFQKVTDSNYDWGQDLKRLAEWTNKNGIDKIAVDYFGGGSPKYYIGNGAESWQSSKGNPKNENIEWIAISINSLQGARGKLRAGQTRNPEDEYSWLKNPYEPYARAGKTMFIYKL
ncbi:glycosyltransferase family 39 protein [Candidatus Wolfebacteria bacterium]|nr:glycosyltransferase family 39 protein [Candidatus Wolfebacteria bacterium]